MQIFTVTYQDRPLAVVRARYPEEAIESARDMADAALLRFGEDLDTREPDDGEMVGWLERRDDYLLVKRTPA